MAFYVYPTAFQAPGGGEIQLLKTHEYLEKLGADVTLLDPWKDRLGSFDILHVFGSVKDCLPMMRVAKTQGTKVLLSTICWYSWKAAWGGNGAVREKILALGRHAAKTLFPAFPSERREMMAISDLLLPNCC